MSHRPSSVILTEGVVQSLLAIKLVRDHCTHGIATVERDLEGLRDRAHPPASLILRGEQLIANWQRGIAEADEMRLAVLRYGDTPEGLSALREVVGDLPESEVAP